MKTLIENLCGKLEDWDIDPIILVKSIGIFLILVVVVALMIIFPVLFMVLLGILMSILLIVLIYAVVEEFT